MHADAFFQAVHHGQDYARAGDDFAIVSDGCSSSRDTDCGARLLTLAATSSTEIDAIVDRAAGTGLLAPEALDATLLVVRREGACLRATAWGDGVVFGVRRDGGVEAWEIDHGGTPAYPAYRRQPIRWATWTGRPKVRHWVGDAATEVDLPVGDFPVFSMGFEPGAWRLVGVASDGLLSFRGPDGLVPLPAVLGHITDVRVPKGRFLERAATFFLRRTCPRLGWAPTDDLSIAAFCHEEVP